MFAKLSQNILVASVHFVHFGFLCCAGGQGTKTRRSWWFSLNVCVGLGLPGNAVKWNINSALGVYNLPPCGGSYIRQRKSVSPLYSCISSFVKCPSLRRKNKAKFAISNMSCCERSAHNVAKIVNYFGETLKIIKKCKFLPKIRFYLAKVSNKCSSASVHCVQMLAWDGQCLFPGSVGEFFLDFAFVVKNDF